MPALATCIGHAECACWGCMGVNRWLDVPDRGVPEGYARMYIYTDCSQTLSGAALQVDWWRETVPPSI